MNTLLRRLVAAACLLACTLAFATDNKSAGTSEATARVAQEWLKLVDAGEYGQSWKEAASRFRASISQDKWVDRMNQGRQPLGAVSARELLESTHTEELPRAPKGDYWVVKFKTTFEAVTAHEIVALAAEPDGTWHVVQFLIKPAA